MLQGAIMNKLTSAQRLALELLSEGRMDDFAAEVHGLRQITLKRLSNRGLIRYQAYAKPYPLWVITGLGREALEHILSREKKEPGKPHK
jgi:hypothetical protein